MDRIFRITISIIILAMVGIWLHARTANAAGLLKPFDGNQSDVQIKSHHVKVMINNGFSKTEVDQVFFNKGDRDLKALYTFPMPKQASLSELSLWIDGQEIVGEVLEKGRAKKIHEEQAARGNDTALAEKNGYKTFDIHVYPVRARDETRVRLVYYQPLEIDLNVGRYVYPLEEGGVDEARHSFWSTDDIVNESFTFNLTLKSAFPVKDLRLPGYQTHAVIQKVGANDAEKNSGETYTIGIDLSEGSTLSRDIVFYYRLDDDIPARLELIPFRENPAEPGTFMVVMTPGASLERIKRGTDWTFVLDISGSMGGNKISTLADGVAKVIGQMSPNDRFRIVTFNDKAHEYSGGYQTATAENVQSMIEKIKAIQAGGGTALFQGLKTGYDGLDTERITGLILVTDGVANVGPSRHADILNLHRKYDIRLFAFIIGNSANQPLLDALARETGGFAMNISSNDDIIGRIIQAKAKVLHESIYDTDIRFRGGKISSITPGEFGNLYLGQQLVLFGRYKDSGEIQIEFSGKIAGESKTWTCKAFLPEMNKDNPELERLWALSSIEDVMAKIRDKGKTPALKQQVMDLGTTYSLVTDYTSMLVISEQEMENSGIQRTNAERVNRERRAQTARSKTAAGNHRVDQSASGGMFDTPNTSGSQKSAYRRSPGIGSGPVGPLFLALVLWLRRKMR